MLVRETSEWTQIKPTPSFHTKVAKTAKEKQNTILPIFLMHFCGESFYSPRRFEPIPIMIGPH